MQHCLGSEIGELNPVYSQQNGILHRQHLLLVDPFGKAYRTQTTEENYSVVG